MNPELRTYLESIGLDAAANTAAAWRFYNGLGGERREMARGLRTARPPAEASGSEPPAAGSPASDGGAGAEATGTATGTSTAVRGTGGSPPPAATPPPADPPGAPQAGGGESPPEDPVLAERQRVRAIQDLAGDEVPADMVRQAIDEGWRVERFSREALSSLRESRGTAVRTGHVAIHSRSHEHDCNLQALQGAMLLRNGVPLDHAAYRSMQARALPGMPAWLQRDLNDDERQRAMDFAHQYAGMALVDVVREAVRMDGGRVTFNNAEMIRAAVSGSNLAAIFSSSVNAELLAAYMDAPDSTAGWVAETDVANFLPHERSAMGKFGQLQKLARGNEAEHLDTDDTKETSKIARYAGQFVVDEQDIIDDRFGALEGETPRDMGNTAANLRPDLVYAILLANAALDADSLALFHASHNNLDTNAFNSANLEAGISKMAKQRVAGRPLNVRARYLLVPHDLRFSADVELTSAERRNQASTDSGTRNPLADLGIQAVADDRLGAAGVTDPDTGTAHTGSATNWFLSARPGENGARTLVVKYRRGTGRAPQVRSFPLTQGRFGIGWDVHMDIGADADDFRGLYKGNS